MRRTSSKVLPPSIKSLRQDENAHMKKRQKHLIERNNHESNPRESASNQFEQ
jgi:hypothetical protein